MAILFTTAIAAVLIITGDLAKLADTTVALLVFVFAIVNVDGARTCAATASTTTTSGCPSIFPVLGVGVSIALLTQIEGEIWARAGILIAIGIVLWLVNELVLRRTACDRVAWRA